ncbi:ZNFX1-like protein [Mya arenaria]|uniref:ZNFX1-like protein n=1 Tax=Mya arenaria TaxID=6604 RepID=A0ABY7G5N3_MYAAR|nr:ZNFX1-like protein [Mya arenaria]
MEQDEAVAIRDIRTLNFHDRGRLYRFWIQCVIDQNLEHIDEKRDEFNAAAERLREVTLLVDMEIMRSSAVVGMTTTCAARYLPALRDIEPKIVIVEEAAEVLEAHIITTLSKGCEHLMWIGDHKQLRPNPTGYNPSQLTVLTTYNGQLLALQKLMPKSEFEGVRVTVVDNYQGEENDIVILSLVRSSTEN